MHITVFVVDQRNPDMFRGLHTWSNHHSYGYQEIILNTMSDFHKELTKKSGRTEKLWAILEALSHWLLDDDIGTWAWLKDGEQYALTSQLIGYAFLTALNRIDREGELHKDSKYKDLSLMLGLWLDMADSYERFEDNNEYPDSDEEDDGPFSWSEYILAYARANDLPIEGTYKVKRSLEERLQKFDNEPRKLPRKAIDRFKWKQMVSIT